ncbi:DNA-3-methyladenine glycosylase I [Sporolactobacillus sp. THM19-2]|uniref:DNA-3-methyladenine glycosylase I n=1 Tax=Sporolactobacillus sp. THM19-2 TaxID=2511171 RepID=UPI001022990F|nr:DNA-3-methyladenine glycosylase I [Sporolactobacillus sp. THM19-2]RYL93177.1 DNA-3-methyladenine glycosylase I [Sporolactobacillus sp. THM19-2]
MPHRCDWHTDDPVYIDYHDREWGRPVYDSKKLFEMLCLEGMQAGLSWITILKRREAYRRAFAGFDPEIISEFTEDQVGALMQNSGIIRNRRKIRSIIQNARSFLELEKEQSFSTYLWRIVGGQPITHCYHSASEIPSSSVESRMMSRNLKKCGFSFVGETICYAFMQAVGMVNDHETTCFCYAQIRDQNRLDNHSVKLTDSRYKQDEKNSDHN